MQRRPKPSNSRGLVLHRVGIGSPLGAWLTSLSWDDGLLGARASRPHDDGFPGARASRPHQAWHSLGHLPHLDQPGTVPGLSFGLADAVSAHRVAACSIALKLSGGQRDRMRAGRRPRRADHTRKNSRSLMKTNHEWTRINTNRPEDRWTSFNHKISVFLERQCVPEGRT